MVIFPRGSELKKVWVHLLSQVVEQAVVLLSSFQVIHGQAATILETVFEAFHFIEGCGDEERAVGQQMVVCDVTVDVETVSLGVERWTVCLY